jgi:hypothetical protein
MLVKLSLLPPKGGKRTSERASERERGGGNREGKIEKDRETESEKVRERHTQHTHTHTHTHIYINDWVEQLAGNSFIITHG